MNNDIEKWIEAKANLTKWKKIESDLRKELIDRHFPNAGEGTSKSFIGSYQLKAVMRMNRSIDRDELMRLGEDMTIAELSCVKWTPSLDMSKFKALSEEERLTLDQCITAKPGMPGLSIELIEE